MLFTATAGTGPDTTFAVLAGLAFQRVAAAALAAKSSDQDRLSLYDLSVIKHQLDLGLHDPDFSYDALVAFFSAAKIVFDIDSADPGAAVSGTFFPMIPALTLTDTLTDGNGTQQHFVAVNYASDPRFMVDQGYESIVDRYFRAFAVSSESTVEQQAAGPVSSGTVRDDDVVVAPESMAQYVFRDYFLMVTQSMVDAAIDYLTPTPIRCPRTARKASRPSLPPCLRPTTPTTKTRPRRRSHRPTSPRKTSSTRRRSARPTITGAFYQANNQESLADIAGAFRRRRHGPRGDDQPRLRHRERRRPNMINAGVQVALGDITYTVPRSAAASAWSLCCSRSRRPPSRTIPATAAWTSRCRCPPARP